MNFLRLVALSLALLSAPATAQWQTPNHSVPAGRGAGVIGFGSVAPGTADLPFLSNGASTDPSFRALPNSGLANATASSIKCNPVASPAAVQDCTIAQISALLAPGSRSITGADAIIASDCQKTVALGGSNFYTVTANAASGYATDCKVTVINADSVCPSGGAVTCRGKTLSVNGYADFILWPGQVLTLINQNNVWQWENPGRWQPKTVMIWYVNHGIGTATTDGLAPGAGAFNTMQKCIDVMIASIDFGGATGPTCQVANETFTENAVSCILPLTGTTAIFFNGNTTTPGNVVWQVTATSGMQVRDFCGVVITGFTMTGTVSAGFCLLTAGQAGLLDFGVMNFGVNDGNNIFCKTPGGSLGYGGGQVTVTGNFNDFVYAQGSGHVIMDGMAINISAVTFVNFVEMGNVSLASLTSLTCTGAGCAAGSVGRKYSVSTNSVLDLNGQVLPGATAGATASGGQIQ